MTHACPSCGRNKHDGLMCSDCGFCGACCDCVALFDADELGLDPETDNTPDHQERTA